MIERHLKIRWIEAETGQHLFDADLIDISTALLKVLLKRSIADQLLAFTGSDISPSSFPVPACG
jgi:hypothetical protein